MCTQKEVYTKTEEGGQTWKKVLVLMGKIKRIKEPKGLALAHHDLHSPSTFWIGNFVVLCTTNVTA